MPPLHLHTFDSTSNAAFTDLSQPLILEKGNAKNIPTTIIILSVCTVFICHLLFRINQSFILSKKIANKKTISIMSSSSSSSLAKQNPAYKSSKSSIDGKVYFSYVDIHETMSSLVPQILEFNPSVIIAIGGGGFIPARILRTELKIPILAVSLELYDDTNNTAKPEVKKIQWFDEQSEVGSKVRNQKILIVDEVDDTRTTLQYCVEEVIKTNHPSEIAVAVLHNKRKPKRGILPDTVTYLSGADVEDHWNCYPWDAAAYGNTIREHESLANKCSEKKKGINK